MRQEKSPAGHETDEGPLRRESLQQQIYERLRQNLVTGAYRPGEVLSSRGLADRLGVSAMPVREALTRLTAEGALEVTRSRTLRLRVLTVEDFAEVTAIRLSLEPMAARRAAERAGPADRALAGTRHAELSRAAAGGTVDAYLVANAGFHRAIYSAARWPILHGAIERLWMIVGPSIRACIPDADHIAVSMRFHDAAYAALHAGDGAALAEAVAGDIRAAASDIRACLESVSAVRFGLETGKATQ